MKAPLIDWTNLQQPLDELLFRQLCSDLLMALGLHVESTPSRQTLFLSDQQPPIRVECCPRMTAEENAVVERLVERLSEVGGTSLDCVVVFTNLPLSETSNRLIERINRSERCGVRISCIGGPDLERLLVCQPKVYRKYFRDRPLLPKELDCSKVRSPRVVCAFGPSTRFLQKDTEMRVRVANSGPSPLDLKLMAADRPLTKLRVGAFGSQTLSIPADELVSSEWSSLTVVADDEAAPPVEIESEPKRPRLPIDHIYIDPLGWREQLRRSLTPGSIVYLSGGPGAGKSRLLREACGLRLRPTWIDLSQGSYGTALVDHILSRVFDLPLETVRLFEETFLASRLQKLGCDELEAQAVVRYVKQDVVSLGSKAFTSVLARLASAAFEEQVLVIDNVHRLRHLDSELLRILLSGAYAGPVVITARDQEIEDPELMILLESISTYDGFVRLTLDRVPVSRLIGQFLREAAADERSLRFLSGLRHAPNMQQFMLAVKSFAARDLIQQEKDGRLRVSSGGGEIQMAEYRDLLNDMLQALGGDSHGDALRRVLECAAVYGFGFDIKFLQQALGDEIEDLLGLLEERELIFPEAGDPDEERYRFDHELTHEIIYGSIPQFRKRRLHREVIGFIETPGRYREGADDGDLARHYEVIQDYAKSAVHALGSARFLVQRSGISDGHKQFAHAVELAEKLRRVSKSHETDACSYVLEAQALEGFIDSGSAISGAVALYHQIRKLDTLLKLHPQDPDKQRLEGRVAFYFARYFNLIGENERARQYIQSAIEQLRAAGELSHLGEALSRACTLEKNCGNWDEAVEYGRQAIVVLEEAQDLGRLSEAYGNLGAVFLEAGRPEETIPWWNEAVKVVEGQGFEPQLCSAQINYAYILALVKPKELDAERELDRGRGLAQRLAMDFDETRARLNLANWIFFHGKDRTQAQRHMDRADELIQGHQDSYLDDLHAFSVLNMEAVSGPERHRLEQQITEAACESLQEEGDLESVGDNRVLNMIEYLALRGCERVQALVLAATGEAPEEYYARVTNPYRRGDRFITLY